MNYAAAASRGSGGKVTSTGTTELYPRLPNTDNDFPALPTRSKGPSKSTHETPERPANCYVLSTSRSESQRGVQHTEQREHIGEGTDYNEHDKKTQHSEKPITLDSHGRIQQQGVTERSDFDFGPSQSHLSLGSEQQNFLQQQDTNGLFCSSEHMARSSPLHRNLSQDNENHEQPNSLGKPRSKVDWNGRNQVKTDLCYDQKEDHKQDKENAEQINSDNRLQSCTDGAQPNDNRDQGFKDQGMNKQNQKKQKGDMTKRHGDKHVGYQSVKEGARPKDNSHHQGRHNRRFQQPDSASQLEFQEEEFEIDPALQEKYKDDKKSMFEFFWKSDSVYSQWHLKEFVVDSQTYICAEQFMMHRKAMLFEDYQTAGKIMATTSPRKQKQLGRQVKNFNEDLWQASCEAIVEEGNIAKFEQNSSLLNIICASNPKIIVEASPLDRIWGIGLAAIDPKAWNRATWCGENRLGKILTKVRNNLMLKKGLITKEEHDLQLKQLEL